MIYWLRHLSQYSFAKVFVLTLLALAMWIYPFINGSQSVWMLLLMLVLTLAGAVGVMMLLLRSGVSNLPSAFALCTAFFLFSSALPLHFYWRGMVVVLILELSLWILWGIDFHTTSQEPMFLSSVLLCIASLILPPVVFVFPVMWLFMLVRRLLTFRSWNVSLLSIMLFALADVLIGVCFEKWIWSWDMLLVPTMDLWWLAIWGISMILAYFPVRVPSLGSGLVWMCSSVGMLLFYLFNLFPHWLCVFSANNS